jgi:hypothetical protein
LKTSKPFKTFGSGGTRARIRLIRLLQRGICQDLLTPLKKEEDLLAQERGKRTSDTGLHRNNAGGLMACLRVLSTFTLAFAVNFFFFAPGATFAATSYFDGC